MQVQAILAAETATLPHPGVASSCADDDDASRLSKRLASV